MAELLIALAILGVIATFTIPKIIVAQQNEKYKAIAKEDIATISGAWQKHVSSGQLSASTYAKDLTQYFNYISVSTSGNIDDRPNRSVSQACSALAPCLKLANGSIVKPNDEYFDGTSRLNGVGFYIDPDGLYTGQEDSLVVIVYYDGRITDRNNSLTSSVNSSGTPFGPLTDATPSWFNW